MERVTAFSNGTEFMMWRDRNCEQCEKDCPFDPETGQYGEAKCDIEEAIAMGAVGDGSIDKALADRAKLPFFKTIEQCPEFNKIRG